MYADSKRLTFRRFSPSACDINISVIRDPRGRSSTADVPASTDADNCVEAGDIERGKKELEKQISKGRGRYDKCRPS